MINFYPFSIFYQRNLLVPNSQVLRIIIKNSVASAIHLTRREENFSLPSPMALCRKLRAIGEPVFPVRKNLWTRYRVRDKVSKGKFSISTKGRVFLPSNNFSFLKFETSVHYSFVEIHTIIKIIKIKKLVTRSIKGHIILISFPYLSHFQFDSVSQSNQLTFQLYLWISVSWIKKHSILSPSISKHISIQPYIYTHDKILFHDAQRSKFSREITQREKVFLPRKKSIHRCALVEILLHGSCTRNSGRHV